MKSAFTLLIGGLFFILSALADHTTNSEYFICNFNETITEFERKELKEQGFQVFEENTNHHVVYVKAKSDAMFSNHLKSKMKELIRVDENGDRIYIVETNPGSSPDFLKVFFNFL